MGEEVDLSAYELLFTPHWATGRYKGALVPGTQLCTKDGERFGNGVVIKVEESHTLFKTWLIATIVTDIGNKIELSVEEVEHCFYEPKWVMDFTTHNGYKAWQADVHAGID